MLMNGTLPEKRIRHAWNKGLTKETSDGVMNTAKANIGRKAWNKGLKMPASYSPWNKGKKLPLKLRVKLSESYQTRHPPKPKKIKKRDKRGWPKGQHRTEDEIIRIREGVKRYYQQSRIYGINRAGSGNNIKDNINKLLKKGKLFEDYDRYMKVKALKDSTREKELRSLARIMRFAEKPLEAMSKDDIYRLVAKIQDQPFSENYKSVLKITIRNLFKFLGKEDYILDIKCRVQAKKDRLLSLEEIKQVIKSTPILEERLFFGMLWESCCRSSELLNLTVDDIRFEDGVCYLNITNSKNKQSERFIPILPKGRAYPLGTHAILKPFVEKAVQEGRERLWSWGNQQQIQHIFRKGRLKLGWKNLHAHLFRKSRASYLDEMGLSLKELSVYGGWSVNSVTLLESYVLCGFRDLVRIMKTHNSQDLLKQETQTPNLRPIRED